MILALATGVLACLALGGYSPVARVVFGIWAGAVAVLIQRSVRPWLTTFTAVVTGAVTYWLAGSYWWGWPAVMAVIFAVAKAGDVVVTVYVYEEIT